MTELLLKPFARSAFPSRLFTGQSDGGSVRRSPSDPDLCLRRRRRLGTPHSPAISPTSRSMHTRPTCERAIRPPAGLAARVKTLRFSVTVVPGPDTGDHKGRGEFVSPRLPRQRRGHAVKHPNYQFAALYTRRGSASALRRLTCLQDRSSAFSKSVRSRSRARRFPQCQGSLHANELNADLNQTLLAMVSAACGLHVFPSRLDRALADDAIRLPDSGRLGGFS